MIKKLPSKEQVKNVKKEGIWDFGNSILYKLCKNHFKHIDKEKVLTKVLFIGRVYSAAIERRKNKDDSAINDDFYTDIVVPKIIQSELDRKLLGLKNVDKSPHGIHNILDVHYYLTDLLNKNVTNQNKRSFTSKYLHFHYPDLYYIFDSRATKALSNFINRPPNNLNVLRKKSNVDDTYGAFFCKCFELNQRVEQEYKISLSPREFDKLLLDISNEENRQNSKQQNP